MTKYISVMIAWIIFAGLLLYVIQHSQDLARGFAYVTKNENLKSFFQSINTLFK